MMTLITPLSRQQNLKSFDSGNHSLNFFLTSTAGQHQRKLISRTFVLTEDAAPRDVLGFYTLTLRNLVPSGQLPASLAKRLPREVPGFTLARLAVDVRHRGKRYGELLLADAILRANAASHEVGGYALFVDAKDDAAAAFYRKFGFVPFPNQRHVLLLPLASIPPP